MICSKCKERQATVQFTIIVNGKKTELYLCEQCARENDSLNLPEEEGIALQTMLAGLLNGEIFKKCVTVGQHEVTQDVECPVCGLMLSDFIKGGRFGCDECYNAFAEKLKAILTRIHGKTRFVGKIPSRLKARTLHLQHIDELRVALAQCVKDERYEDAVKLRDEIRFLEKAAAETKDAESSRQLESDKGTLDG